MLKISRCLCKISSTDENTEIIIVTAYLSKGLRACRPDAISGNTVSIVLLDTASEPGLRPRNCELYIPATQNMVKVWRSDDRENRQMDGFIANNGYFCRERVCICIVTLRTAVFGSDGGVGAVLLYISSAIFANLSSAMFLNRIPPFASGISKTRTARFVSFMLNIRDFEYFAAKTAAWLLAVVPLASGIFLFARHGILRLLFELLPLAAAYAISLKHTRLGAAGIMSRTTVFTGFFILFPHW